MADLTRADIDRLDLDRLDALLHPSTPQSATLTESHLGGDAIARLGAMCAAYPALLRMARASLDTVPATDFDAQVRHALHWPRRARRWEAAARRWWQDLGDARHDAARARRERDTARRELGEVREVLREIEWEGRDQYEPAPGLCPVCERYRREGHRDDCALSAALKEDKGNG